MPRFELVRNHDIANGHSLDAALRRTLGRERLDESFLFVWANRNDDLVGRKGRESVPDGETNVRLAGDSFNGLARKPLGGAFGNSLRVPERLLVAGEPVEYALSCDRHHDRDCVGLTDVCAQNVARIVDRADHEDVLGHDGNVPSGTIRG